MTIEVAPAGLKPTKTCTMCGQIKDTKADFYWMTDTRAKRRPHGRCKDCHNSVVRGLQQRYREGRFVASRANGLVRQRVRRYGITEGELEAMRLFQGGRCALCYGVGKQRDLHVDHDHRTGRVRGMLCGGCNAKLAWLEGRRARIMGYLSVPTK